MLVVRRRSWRGVWGSSEGEQIKVGARQLLKAGVDRVAAGWSMREGLAWAGVSEGGVSLLTRGGAGLGGWKVLG